MNSCWVRISRRLLMIGGRTDSLPYRLHYRSYYFSQFKDSSDTKRSSSTFISCHRPNSLYKQIVRSKYNKQSNQPPADESDSDGELGDFKDEPDGKVIKTSVKSLRLDLIVKSGLGLARNKVENIFYENKIRVNGAKVAKKSMLVEVGDEIDIVKGFSTANPEHLQVGRVQLLASSEKEEGYRVAFRRFKSIIIENYPGHNAWKA